MRARLGEKKGGGGKGGGGGKNRRLQIEWWPAVFFIRKTQPSRASGGGEGFGGEGESVGPRKILPPPPERGGWGGEKKERTVSPLLIHQGNREVVVERTSGGKEGGENGFSSKPGRAGFERRVGGGKGGGERGEGPVISSPDFQTPFTEDFPVLGGRKKRKNGGGGREAPGPEYSPRSRRGRLKKDRGEKRGGKQPADVDRDISSLLFHDLQLVRMMEEGKGRGGGAARGRKKRGGGRVFEASQIREIRVASGVRGGNKRERGGGGGEKLGPRISYAALP